ncbi:MAG: proline dehydrogenase family protein [Alicyclobacillaceae bacterium]|nr:proline dehydrogenase family protein [Alicyclobacillaceae bacterium]
MERLVRGMFLAMAGSAAARRLARRYGLCLGAARFVAGETIDAAIEVVRKLNRSGMSAILDHLGEFVQDAAEAAAVDELLAALAAITAARVDSSVSVKLMQLGLDVDRELCAANLRRILAAARDCQLQVTIDMEDYRHCQAIFDLFEQMRREFDNVGTVVQAYLYRSFEDVLRLGAMGAHLRIVKGAYREPASVAYPDKSDVDANYVKLMEASLLGPGFTAIATHDEQIIRHAISFISARGLSRDKYEFQMLYGIRPQLQMRLAEAGYPVRIYVPYGTDWFGYFMRRLAERPANVAFVLRGLMR